MLKILLPILTFIWTLGLASKEAPLPFAGSLQPLTTIKTQDQAGIPFIRKAAKVTVEAMKLVQMSARPGMSEKDLEQIINDYFKSQGFGLSFSTISVSGKNTSDIHGVPGERIILDNDIIMVDIGARYEGPEGTWCSDMTRTFFVGNATSRQMEIYNIVDRAQKSALSKVKAGAKIKDVSKAATSVVRDAGYTIPHSLGHGVGEQVHVSPLIDGWSTKTLKVGDVITIEPGIYLSREGFGVRIEDLVIVTEDGYESLTSELGDLQYHPIR